MLCSFLPYKKMNQPDMTYMPSFLDFLPIQFTTLQLSSVSCTIQYILISYQFYTQYRQYICVNPNLPVPLSLLSPLYPFICSLKLGLFFCFANRIIYTIFLDAYCYIHSLVFWAGKLLALYKHSSTISFIKLHCYNYYICTFGYKGICTCKFSSAGDIHTLFPVSLSISLFYFLKIFITTVFLHSLTVHLIIKNDFRFFSPFYSQRISHIVIQICY